MNQIIDLLKSTRPAKLTDAREEVIKESQYRQISYTPSPVNWRNEILYFLLPDRFSDGKEAEREMLTREEINRFRREPYNINWREWANSGKQWQGGTLKGIESKLGYLAQLGITAIWIGPVFKQRIHKDSYHGYGIQDFLDVDPRFGTRKDLVELVASAHQKNIKVILDIVINHSGDKWGYCSPQHSLMEIEDRTPAYRNYPDYYGNPLGSDTKTWKTVWRNENEKGFTQKEEQITEADQAVWPRTLQNFANYTRAGRNDWSLMGNDLSNEHAEHKRADFDGLKDFALDNPVTLNSLSDIYKYWIALTDCDGFRIDTVKHISLMDARNFCGAILEFAESIGKYNFLLVGEVGGGDANQEFILDKSMICNRNLKAALDIGSRREELQLIGKGLIEGKNYIDCLREQSQNTDTHRSFGDRYVSVLDDHDHVMGNKIRFSYGTDDDNPFKDYQIVVPIAIQLFTLAIPCIYYGDEQAFSGPPHSQIPYLLNEGWNRGDNWGDRYLREAMFGPEHPRAGIENDILTQLEQQDNLPGFGPFGISGKHCFDPKSPSYIRIAHLCKVRSEHYILTAGRQYTRKFKRDGNYIYPVRGEWLAWSRILDIQEAVIVTNPNVNVLSDQIRIEKIEVSAEFNKPGDKFKVVANTDQIAKGADYHGSHPVGSFIFVNDVQTSSEEQMAGSDYRAVNYQERYITIQNIPPAEVLVLLKE